MCKKKVVDKDESANIQTTQLGLLNMETSSAGAIGVMEVVAMVLLVMCILLCCHYCNRRFRKRRQRELHDAVQGGLNGNVGFRAARGPASVPMVTFSDPGVRSVTLTQPSAPMLPALPTPKAAVLPALQQGLNVQPAERIGLWEQCR